MSNQILSEENINKIVGHAYQISNEPTINFQVEQALMGMLKITHLFKFEMDRESMRSQRSGNVQTLLLHTLYALNGSNYQTNEPAYDISALFDRIFVSVPKGKEFDIEIIRFLLLPIYNSIRNTNFEISEVFQGFS